MRTHGLSGTKLYYIWIEMRQRCTNPNHRHFRHYGKRGITVCEEWLHDFETFREWALSNGYKDGLSIDRRNNDGNYHPDNCRWVQQVTQCNNTRRCKMITYQDQCMSMADWARFLGINYRVLRSRFRIGWSTERAFETPCQQDHLRRRSQ